MYKPLCFFSRALGTDLIVWVPADSPNEGVCKQVYFLYLLFVLCENVGSRVSVELHIKSFRNKYQISKYLTIL